MVPLRVRVDSGLWLDMGYLLREGAVLTIQPPRKSVFDQLRSYLHTVPVPAADPPNLTASMVGIGATALCLRWGTYLAFLWDPDKPVDPLVHAPDASLIDDTEMARINIEASSNLAALLTLQHDEPAAFNRLLWTAYAYLPMPWRRLRPARDEAIMMFQRGMSFPSALLKHVPADLSEQIGKQPLRAYANVLINTCWRNSPIEDLHAGRVPIRSLTCRRAAPSQANGVLRVVSARLAAALGGPPPWLPPASNPTLPWPTCVQGLYAVRPLAPRGWSFTDRSRTIQLDLETPQPTPARALSSQCLAEPDAAAASR